MGADIGIQELGLCFNGQVLANPKAYRRMSKKLKRQQRAVIRKARGYNRTKAVNKLAELHAKIAKFGKNALHKLTYYLAQNQGEVKIDDLSIKAFLKYQNLAGATADYGMYKVKTQLEYKAEKF